MTSPPDHPVDRQRLVAGALFVTIAVLVAGIDRITKAIVTASMQVGEQRDLAGPVLELRYVQNRGIAFGMFADFGPLVVAGSMVVGVLLFAFLLRVEPSDRWTIAGVAMITGGAIGNLADRIQHGYVVDFLHLPRWPTFNVADMGIVGGVACVIAMQWIVARRELRGDRG